MSQQVATPLICDPLSGGLGADILCQMKHDTVIQVASQGFHSLKNIQIRVRSEKLAQILQYAHFSWLMLGFTFSHFANSKGLTDI